MRSPAWIRFVNGFVKFTGLVLQFFCFRTKVHYEDRTVQGRRIKGPALIVSNHTSLFDYAVYIFVFFTRTLRVLMAEVLFEKPLLGWFLRSLGGIKVDRNSRDLGFVDEALDILGDGGVVGIFPESRLPKPGEAGPLPFKESVALIAMKANVPVIPVVTNGSYFNRKRAHVIIGKPVDVSEWIDPELEERENISRVTEKLRGEIIRLGDNLNEMVL